MQGFYYYFNSLPPWINFLKIFYKFTKDFINSLYNYIGIYVVFPTIYVHYKSAISHIYLTHILVSHFWYIITLLSLTGVNIRILSYPHGSHHSSTRNST